MVLLVHVQVFPGTLPGATEPDVLHWALLIVTSLVKFLGSETYPAR